MGCGARDIGLDVREPATPGGGQLVWVAAAGVIAAAAVGEMISRRRRAP